MLEFKPDTEWDESQSVLHCARGPDATLVEATIDFWYCLWEASKNIVERSYTVARVVEVDLKKVDRCIINLSEVSTAQAAGLDIKSAETSAWKSAIALSHVTASALTGRKWCVDAVAAREQRDQRKVANLLGNVRANDAQWHGYTLKHLVHITGGSKHSTPSFQNPNWSISCSIKWRNMTAVGRTA